ncbi:MAG: FlgD immunoglobulin-like domain containing protein [Candidatus Eisenbacteria bacterium]
MCQRKATGLGLGLLTLVLMSSPAVASGTSPYAAAEIQLIQDMPQYIMDRLDNGNHPDQNGMIGYNRDGWLFVGFQRGGMLYLLYSAVDGDEAGANDAWRAIDAAFYYQRPDGSFHIGHPMGPYIARVDSLNDVSFWLAKLCHALVVLQASPLGPAFESRIQALLPKIELSALWLADGVDVLAYGDSEAPNRLFFHACAFGFAGILLGNTELIALGQQFVAQGLGVQREDGVFLELGGHDSSYQGVSLLQLQQYEIHFPRPPYKAAIQLGAAWEVTRVTLTGEIDCTDNTRTGLGQEDFIDGSKEVAYIEVLLGLLYCGEAQNHGLSTAAAIRIFDYLSGGSTGAGVDDVSPDGEPLQPSIVLHHGCPNPFSGTTTIGYTLASGQSVRMAVYDMLGRRVRTLVNGQRPEGYSRVIWDSTDDAGNPVSPGVYVISLEGPGSTQTRKVLLVE